jgi:hypothetical protein
MKKFSVTGVILSRPTNSHGVAYITTLYGSTWGGEYINAPKNLIYCNKASIAIAPNTVIEWKWSKDMSYPYHISYDKNNKLALYSEGLFVESIYFTWDRSKTFIWIFNERIYYTSTRH